MFTKNHSGVQSSGKSSDIMHVAQGKEQSAEKLAQYGAIASLSPLASSDPGSPASSSVETLSACKAMSREICCFSHVERQSNNDFMPWENAELF